MSILQEIVKQKQIELEAFEDLESLIQKIDDLDKVESLPLAKGFTKAIMTAEGPGIIAEIKKASPSKGVIREDFDVSNIAMAYEAGGAACLSILTDNRFFQGSYENLIVASTEVELPCLCKEFIIDMRQIAQARLSGADAILLIAAILDQKQLELLSSFAKEMGLDVLFEVHDDADMEKVLTVDPDMIGINNRDLRTFEVSLDTTSRLISKYKHELQGLVLISESGINSHKDIYALQTLGVKGFLVGESLLRQGNLTTAVEQLLV